MDRPTVPVNAAVQEALAIARLAGGWDAVRMQDVARSLGVALADVLREFPDRDALAEACFDAADRALIALADAPGWRDLDVRERLGHAIFTWLNALPERRLVRGMLAYKFQPEHMHLQALGVMRISRTVQTMREVAALRAIGWRREAEEAALTSIYLATFASWLADASPDSQRTRAWLARALDFAQRVGGWSG